MCFYHGGAAPQVQAAAKRRLEAMDLNPKRILRELECLAFSDVTAYLNDDGTLRPLSELDAGQKAALQSFDIAITNGDGHQTRTYRIRYWDKLKALELLARHFGLLEKDNSGGGVIEIRWQQPEPKVIEAKAIEIPASVAPRRGRVTEL